MNRHVRRSLAWLMWREWAVASRTPAVWAGACCYVVLLALFLIIWGDGVPGVGAPILDQYGAVHLSILIALMPWLACRLSGASIIHLDRASILTPCTPRQFVVSQIFALCATLVAIEFLSLPLTVIAARISAADMNRVAGGLVPAIALCTWIAASASAASLTLSSPLMRWIAVTAGAIGVYTALSDSAIAIALLFAASAVVALAAIIRANRRAREERRAEPARPRQDAYVV
jgi:hypothetical protein